MPHAPPFRCRSVTSASTVGSVSAPSICAGVGPAAPPLTRYWSVTPPPLAPALGVASVTTPPQPTNLLCVFHGVGLSPPPPTVWVLPPARPSPHPRRWCVTPPARASQVCFAPPSAPGHPPTPPVCFVRQYHSKAAHRKYLLVYAIRKRQSFSKHPVASKHFPIINTAQRARSA